MDILKLTSIVFLGLLPPLGEAVADEHLISTDGSDPKTWDHQMDGPIAAPENHKVIFEDENIRIVSVSVLPGAKEPYHAHFRCSVMVYDTPAKSTDYDKKGNVAQRVSLGSIPWQAQVAANGPPLVFLQPPQALHSIINKDNHALHLTRIELKKGCQAPSQ